MIISIESDLATFKTVHFQRGLNILLSDKSKDSGLGKTRNSAGKTSLVEILHFMLGANVGKDTLLGSAALRNYTFRASFEFDGQNLHVSRCGAQGSRIIISEDEAQRFGLKGRVDKKTGVHSISNDSWKEFLGYKMFGLPSVLEGSAFDVPNAPSFRSLINYFARRWGSKGFLRPEQQSEMQQRADWQINLSYLFGLDWRIPNELQKVREREKNLDDLRRAAKSGTIGDVIGTVAELRPKLALAEANAKKLREDIANFQVLDSYREQSDRAARARTEMLAIERRAVALKDMVAYLRDTLNSEQAPEAQILSRMYQAVGVELPGVAVRRFEEVAAFHASVIANRRAHLSDEITKIEREIDNGDKRAVKLNAERSEILNFLSGGGALEDFVSLQKRLAILEAEAANLAQRYQSAEYLEGETTKLEIERANIKQRLQSDHQARKSKIDRAIIIIGEAISKLYDDRTGEFVLEATDNGPEFSITIQGDRGAGISNMEIFCFDLALFEITSEERRGPAFLIHDSHLFDGVDERQIAQALYIGAEAAERVSGQYLVLLNSDIFDKLPSLDGVDRDAAVLLTRLSDQSDAGGLFGFRFD